MKILNISNWQQEAASSHRLLLVRCSFYVCHSRLLGKYFAKGKAVVQIFSPTSASSTKQSLIFSKLTLP